MSASSKKVRVAAVQTAPTAFDLVKSISKLESHAKAARENGAQLVVFPEAFLSAYPRHLEFRVGSRSTENREWYSRYVKSSVKVPEGVEGEDWLNRHSPQQQTHDEFWAFKKLCQAARDNVLHLSVGVVERSLVGSTLWCTNLLFSPDGRLLSKHRKLQPTAAERIVWGQGEGYNPRGRHADPIDAAETNRLRGSDNLPVVQTSLGRIGGLICWENFMPLARYLLYQKGVEIYTAPTADARTTWLPSMQHIAQEGRCFVVSANQYQIEADFPSDYPARLIDASNTAIPSEQHNGVTPNGAEQKVDASWSRGGSCIIDPLGQVLAGPLWDKEGTIFADLDLDSLPGARLDFDPVGHYSRHELLLGLLNKY